MKNVPELRFKGLESNYEIKKISSLLERVSNSVDVNPIEFYRQIGIRSHGKGIFYKDAVSGESLGNKRVFWVEPNVFILNIVFAWERAVAKTTDAEIGMIASHRFPMYKPKSGVLDLDYITLFFKTTRGKYLLELASPGGAGRNKTLGQKEFENLELAIPTIFEQKKIAAFFSLIDKKIELQTEKVEELKNYKKGLMQKIFSQELRFKDENGNKYPEWEEKTLQQIGFTYAGLSGKTKEDFGFGNGSFVTYINVFRNTLAKRMIEQVNISEQENQNPVLKGDLLFTTSSETPNEVGMVSCWDYEIKNLYLNSFCFGYRIYNHNSYSPIFLAYMLRSGEYRKKISILAQGSTRYNISKTELMKMKVQCPCMEEQQKIVALLLNLELKTEEEQNKLNELLQYKKGLLQQMFI
ncbi:restriction endonuclease subunit S [Turicibacter sp. TA25]|uniref:restriction endonuclease subunit S n=1 Tax=Turicibacter sp. TA25 TaxID=2951142 RepID=UPI0021D4CF77|nr:restriction endonuclease subunit S [Turicibacter sp. TA25]MCU7203919.1 restriction endonuclease subunit S [Turicibacter sp. TA25]